MDRRESNMMALPSASFSLAPSGQSTSPTSHASPTRVNPALHSSGLTKLNTANNNMNPEVPPPVSYTKPNLDALGRNTQNAHFSSVKWGGTPAATLTNFASTMKSIPKPAVGMHSKMYPKKLNSPKHSKSTGSLHPVPTKVSLPSVTVEQAGVNTISYTPTENATQSKKWRNEADSILSKTSSRQKSYELFPGGDSTSPSKSVGSKSLASGKQHPKQLPLVL